jgi:LPPG:FO 2-phospho-L-lactate transferase
LARQSQQSLKVAALAGGVGGAKLADGLARCLAPDDLTIIVNTGDDFEHLGLYICPDLDTVCYTLAGVGNPITGWGRADESFSALETISELGGPGWFRLGDRDLGLHLERTRRLRRGESLTQVTEVVCRAWGILPRVLPMSDDSIPTSVYTIDQGELPFQEYFVRRQCHPQVTGFRFNNIESARPAPGVVEALRAADLVIICPSNPWVSIAPILAVPGIRPAVEGKIVLAVSPILGGQTVKGPAAKMYAELGIEPSALAVARHYETLLMGFVLDEVDEAQVENVLSMGIQPLVTDSLMKTPADRQRLAEQVIEFGKTLEEKSPQR